MASRYPGSPLLGADGSLAAARPYQLDDSWESENWSLRAVGRKSSSAHEPDATSFSSKIASPIRRAYRYPQRNHPTPSSVPLLSWELFNIAIIVMSEGNGKFDVDRRNP